MEETLQRSDTEAKAIAEAKARIVRTGGSVSETTKRIVHRLPGIKVLGSIDLLVNRYGWTWTRQ